MTMNTKINQTVAGALAEQIVSELHAIRKKSRNDLEIKVKKDPLVLKGQALKRQKEKISADIEKIETSLREKYKLRSCYLGTSGVSVNQYEDNGIPSVSVVKSDIIIANHVDGIGYNEMKKHIIKKHS